MVIQEGADILFLIPLVAYKMHKHLFFYINFLKFSALPVELKKSCRRKKFLIWEEKKVTFSAYVTPRAVGTHGFSKKTHLEAACKIRA